MSAAYVLPPEYHILPKNSKFIVIDPINFVWFVTDETGKAALEGLAKEATVDGAATGVSLLLGQDGDADSIGDYATRYIDSLKKIGFLFEGEYKPATFGSGILQTPTIMYLHLTNKCNLRCPYCYNQEHRTSQLVQINKPKASSQLVQISKSPISEEEEEENETLPELPIEGSTENFLRVINEAAELGFREVKLTGGEALINKDALKIASHAKSRGMRVNLLTNAVLITDETLQKIAQAVDVVSISLDSDKPEEHDAVRGKGTHTKVLDAIRRLKRAGVKVHLNAVITPVNLASVSSFFQFATDELQANDVTVSGSALNVEDPSGRWGAAKYMLNQAQYREVYRQQRDFESARNHHEKGTRRSSLWRRHCGVGNGLISIDPNGDVFPCQTLHRPEFLCGNAFRSGLKAVLESSGVIKEMKRSAVDVIPECKTCPVRYVCSAGCRSEAYSREGDFLARNRAMCPTYYEMALDKLWDAATIPAQESNQSFNMDETRRTGCY